MFARRREHNPCLPVSLCWSSGGRKCFARRREYRASFNPFKLSSRGSESTNWNMRTGSSALRHLWEDRTRRRRPSIKMAQYISTPRIPQNHKKHLSTTGGANPVSCNTSSRSYQTASQTAKNNHCSCLFVEITSTWLLFPLQAQLQKVQWLPRNLNQIFVTTPHHWNKNSIVQFKKHLKRGIS